MAIRACEAVSFESIRNCDGVLNANINMMMHMAPGNR